MRMLGLVCIGVIAALCSGAVEAQNSFPAKWRADYVLHETGTAGNRRLVDASNCTGLAAAIVAQVEADAAAIPVTVQWSTPPVCDSTSGSITWGYCYEEPFGCGNPQGGQRSMTLTPYCVNGNNQTFDPDIGVYCPHNDMSYLKNVGFCPDCTVGNPISVGIGNKFQRETDYVALGAFPLRFERYYNSAGAAIAGGQAGLGVNWSHSLYRSLGFSTSSTASVTLVAAYRPDGKAFAFRLDGTAYVADLDNKSMRLERLSSQWKITTSDDEVELYDNSGRLLSIANRAGLLQTFSYYTSGADAGRLQSVSDPFERKLTFQYFPHGEIKTMTDPEGGMYSFLYGVNGQLGSFLTSVTYPGSAQRSYAYQDVAKDASLLTGITDELSVSYATYGYGDFPYYRAILTRRGAGTVDADRFEIDYPGGGSTNETTVKQYVNASLSATRTYLIQDVLDVQRQSGFPDGGPVCPSCGPKAQTFDANGNVSTSVDWNGNQTNFFYDLGRNLETSRVEGLAFDPKIPEGRITAQTRTITTEWHTSPSFRLVTKTAEPLRRTTYTYNGDGEASCGFMANGTTLVQGVVCTKTVRATTDPDGAQGFTSTVTGLPRVWRYTYNANGQVKTVNGPRTDVVDLTTYTYYANTNSNPARRANISTIEDALGHVTQIIAYNIHGQPLTIVDPNGLTTTLKYDTRQRLTCRNVGGTDCGKGGETTTFTYDDAGQLTKVKLPDESYLSYIYDSAHRLTGVLDSLGNRIAYQLDIAGNRIAECVFANDSGGSWVCNPPTSQDVCAQGSGSGPTLAQKHCRVFDNLNRMSKEIGATNQITEYGYDNQGNVTSVKDPLTQITGNQYDALNRLKQVTDPNSGLTKYGYNGLDALTQVTDPRNLATGYDLDGLGNLNQQTSPDTGITANINDAAGNLISQKDAKGQVTAYAYDALNRVASITFNDASKQTYAYDQGTNGVGRLSSITETNSASQVTNLIAYAYNQMGRVTTETRTVNGIAYLVTYSYDSSGRLTGLTYPSGRTVTYVLDALGRVNQITTTKSSQSNLVLQNVAYHPFGGAKSWTLGNGQAYSRAVDQDGRIASYTLGATNYVLTFDPASRITYINNPAYSYGYDVLDRLTSAVVPSSSYSYGYDGSGNRLTKTASGTPDIAYAYETTSNRISSLTPFGGSQRIFQIDPNGSTTNDALNTYVYDTRGRMLQASNGAGTTNYQVNALGQRIRKTGSAVDTIFIYDIWGKLIAESDPGGITKREYIYLGDIPVGVVQ